MYAKRMDKETGYYKKLVRQAREKHTALLDNPEFQKRVSKFRHKWSIHDSGLKTDQEMKDWLSRFEENPIITVHTDLKKIMHKHALSPNMELVVYRYCVYNDRRLPISMLPKIHIETADKENGNFELRLIIGPDTTERDMLAIWPFVKEKQKELASWKKVKSQPYLYLERDKYAYNLSRKGVPHKKIAEMIMKEFSLHEITYSNVANYIRRYKKHINM